METKTFPVVLEACTKKRNYKSVSVFIHDRSFYLIAKHGSGGKHFYMESQRVEFAETLNIACRQTCPPRTIGSVGGTISLKNVADEINFVVNLLPNFEKVDKFFIATLVFRYYRANICATRNIV